MSDPIFTDSPSAPARRCFVVTPHDSQPLPYIAKALRADGAGSITFRPIGQDQDVSHPVLAGERIDVHASHVRATGTTGQTVIVGYA